jgi:hypothetical protein
VKHHSADTGGPARRDCRKRDKSARQGATPRRNAGTAQLEVLAQAGVAAQPGAAEARQQAVEARTVQDEASGAEAAQAELAARAAPERLCR